MSTHPPNLKQYMDKKVSVHLNGKRHIIGIMCGYDAFMNITIDNTMEVSNDGQQTPIGTVVVRGNSIVRIEAIEKFEK